MARRATDFQTIHSEGGLLPHDLLRRVIDPKEKLNGSRPEDYGLPPGERLNEVITQSWNRLRKHWADFRAAAANLPEGEAGTGLTNDKWSLPLLRELGFGLLPTSAGPEVGGRAYAINRFFGPVPIHLIGCGLNLDRRSAGIRGASAANPHGLAQEFLNRSPGHLWAIVSNGLRLRILRDSQALSRQSYLEFDLEAMFSGEVFSDFALLWLMAHATRFAPREAERPETCWLEQWTKIANEQGARALGDLRGGVERALQILGEGFTGHQKNTALRDALRTGQVSLADFHGQLLRVVYRLIFLFVAEDRMIDGESLLHPRDDSDAARLARECYDAHYSTARMRDLASKIKGSRHGDLWRQFQIIVKALSGDADSEAARANLALPALGGFLWAPASTKALNDVELTNHDFLEALRHLAFTRQGKTLRPVDYKNLGAEELGGVYESLLALTPQLSADGARFSFAEFAGNERKTSGSYYTPDSLVQCLLDSALDPVVEEAIKGKSGAEAEKAILDLKVCDPAVGSGHFLVGAAHRLARHLARVRALAQGESEPSPLLYQHALRDVIGRCLYGVDINPMAAELCRVSLWLEALEPGKPLSFLDHHIRVGNSLLGATPALLKKGIPDDAFKPIEGDDKKICTQFKKMNKEERETRERSLPFDDDTFNKLGNLAEIFLKLDVMEEETIEAVKKKQERYEQMVKSEGYLFGRLWADAWCAAFVWKKVKTQELPWPITEEYFRRIEESPYKVPQWMRDEIKRLAEQYQFFHWHLEFPDVFKPKPGSEIDESEVTGWSGGFDCVLGNPPWDMVELSEKEFFGSRDAMIADAPTARKRQEFIQSLALDNPSLFASFLEMKRHVYGTRHFVQHSGHFSYSSVGRINMYPLFVENAAYLSSLNGRSGIVVPSAISMDAYNAPLFSWLIEGKRLVSLFDFDNTHGLFPEVDSRFRFCLLTTTGAGGNLHNFRFCFYAHEPSELRLQERVVSLSFDQIFSFSPNTLAPPMFQNAKDAALARLAYELCGVLSNHRNKYNSWQMSIQRMLSLSDPGDLFRRATELTYEDFEMSVSQWTRLHSGKAIHQYDHRFATFDGKEWLTIQVPQKRQSDLVIRTEYYVRSEEVSKRLLGKTPNKWLLVYRDVTNATNERTAIAAAIPYCGCDTTCRNLFSSFDPRLLSSFLACMNSFAFDYFTRQKVIGMHLGAGVFEQLPVPPPQMYDNTYPWNDKDQMLQHWLRQRVLELTYTAWDLEPFAQDCGYNGPPFRWDEERRFLLRYELDAAFFHLYLPAEPNGEWKKVEGWTEEDLALLKASFRTPRDAVSYIMDTFPIVKRKDEAAHGSYRTKDTIHEIYDEMARVMAENAAAVAAGREATTSYQTRLNPPPGPPVDVQGNFIPMSQWDRAHWPSHIHPPREEEIPAIAPLPAVAATAPVIDTAFPQTERDRTLCAAALELMRANPNQPSVRYLEMLLLATHPQDCKALIPSSDRQRFGQAVRRMSDEMKLQQGERIGWRRIRDYLETARAVTISDRSGDQNVSLGSDYQSIRSSLPQISTNFIPFVREAAGVFEQAQADTQVAAQYGSVVSLFRDMATQEMAMTA